MAVAALTLTTALASAEAVYTSKGKRLCLNRNFKTDENFDNRATIEQLMAQVEKLPAKEGKAEKKRLIVFLGLLYPADKKAESKEKPKQPESIEDLKKAMLAMFKVSAPGKTAPARVGSLLEIAKQIQKELSILLLAHEYFECEREFIEQRSKTIQKQKSYAITGKDVDLEVPEMFALHVLCKFKSYQDPRTGNKVFCFNAETISDKAYKKVISLLNHPHPLVKNFANKIYSALQCAKEHDATGLPKKISSIYRPYINRLLIQNSQNNEIVSRVCPEIMQFFELLDSALEEEKLTMILNLGVSRLEEFHKDFPKDEFLARYRKLFDEFQESQKKLLADKKEALAKKLSGRLGDFFLPKTQRREGFPSPDELVKKPAEPKKPAKKTSQAKEQPPIDAVSKVAKETHLKMDEKEKATKAPEDTSFVRKILQSRKFPEIVYDERVKDWQVARSDFPSGHTPEDAIWKHAFTTLVDPFVGTDYSFKDFWNNPSTGNNDPCYCILADVTFPSGVTVQGVFQYTFDANGVCYHRWFGKMSNIERLDKAIHEKRFKINFPPLGKAKSPSVEEVDKIKFEIDPYFGSITFDDMENGLKIKIYKVED